MSMDEPPQPGTGPESTGNKPTETREALRHAEPRIYVASLSDYNAGTLQGAWIDAAQEPEELHEAVTTMLRRSPTAGAEEFAIHDFEGFGYYHPGEYDSLARISKIGCGIATHGLAFGAWADHVGDDEDALDRFDDVYLGDWASLDNYAEELLDDLGYLRAIDDALPDALQPYVRVDVEAFARDLELGGDVTAIEHDGGVWIFEGGV
jgi:antirestriction protein